VTNGSDCLPVIRCSCGFKLLLLPDVQVMGQAIENHALEHKKKHGLSHEQTKNLKDGLIIQAFEMASEKSKQEGCKKSVES
jgi:hypothetical protein